MGAVRKELKRNFHGQHGGKKRDLKKNHKRSTGDVRRDQGAKRRGLLALKARPGKGKRQKIEGGDKVPISKFGLWTSAVVFIGPIKTYLVF